MEKSIELCRITMSESSLNDEFYPEMLSTLAAYLFRKYRIYNRSEDIHEAIIHAERALELCPDNTIYRRKRAELYQFRFDITNDIGDLDAAISETRKCLDSNMLQGLDQALVVLQLASTLVLRFETTWVVEDLNEAIGMVKELVDNLSQGIMVRPSSDDYVVFSVYGALLNKKFEVTGNIDDLHEAHSQLDKVCRLAPPHSNCHPTYIHKYAGSLLRLYEETDNVEYLNRSIDRYHKANDLYGGNDANNLYQYGVSLVTRVEQTQK